MRKLSITEFDAYCKESGFSKFIISSKNQRCDSGWNGNIGSDLCFNRLLTTLSPNMIYLVRDIDDDGINHVFYFSNVMYILSEKIDGRSVFTVVCKGDNYDDKNSKFVVCAL